MTHCCRHNRLLGVMLILAALANYHRAGMRLGPCDLNALGLARFVDGFGDRRVCRDVGCDLL